LISKQPFVDVSVFNGSFEEEVSNCHTKKKEALLKEKKKIFHSLSIHVDRWNLMNLHTLRTAFNDDWFGVVVVVIIRLVAHQNLV
jgi:hypothetical protein